MLEVGTDRYNDQIFLRGTVGYVASRRPNPKSRIARTSETFGYDQPAPWAENALRLILNVPRLYRPLANAWEEHYPGTIRALRRLQEGGWIAYQAPLIIDTRTGIAAATAGKPVERFVLTAKGKRLLESAFEDFRQVEATFPKAKPENLFEAVNMLAYYELDGSHAKYGLSMANGTSQVALAPRSGRWWVRKFENEGYLRELPTKLADVREVVPAHWRVTGPLIRQLRDVVDAFDHVPATLKGEFRLSRTSFLHDLNPARLGVTGATDYDHDVQAQRIVARILLSPSAEASRRLTVEPWTPLPVNTARAPWTFDASQSEIMPYQPDAILQERGRGKQVWRTVLEYERYQSRRDGWNHIERFLGWVHIATLPMEPAILRFVVDSSRRATSYAQLIDAFAEYSFDNPARIPQNTTRLAVTSVKKLEEADDPLDPSHWYVASLGSSDTTLKRAPVVHAKKASPFDDYVNG